ncbi:MAG: hypothetical protein IJF02_02245 [Oscillospiraceae bacterium]|nr:hypothetical protein [Oscillospiraceae bacterium]
MGDAFSRILIQTTVRKAIRDIRETPQRSTRNLIDMALHFSNGRFQQEFFQMAQKMLSDERSAYYTLLQDLATHVDEEKLLTFGMNVGYNSATFGAKRIRQLEETDGYNIPWTLCLELNRASFAGQEERYHTLIEAGEEMGIFTWMLFSHSCAADCIELAVRHPNSAFVLFCDHGEINWPLIDCASDLNNLMLAVPMDENAELTCDLLREAGILYSVYTFYGEDDLKRIQSGDLFCDMEQLHPVFSAFIPKPGCPQSVQMLAYEAIHAARMAQTHATMLWELQRDCMVVDRIISGDGCWAGFDAEGMFHGIDENGKKQTFTVTDPSLEALFKQAFPKE